MEPCTRETRIKSIETEMVDVRKYQMELYGTIEQLTALTASTTNSVQELSGDIKRIYDYFDKVNAATQEVRQAIVTDQNVINQRVDERLDKLATQLSEMAGMTNILTKILYGTIITVGITSISAAIVFIVKSLSQTV